MKKEEDRKEVEERIRKALNKFEEAVLCMKLNEELLARYRQEKLKKEREINEESARRVAEEQEIKCNEVQLRTLRGKGERLEIGLGMCRDRIHELEQQCTRLGGLGLVITILVVLFFIAR